MKHLPHTPIGPFHFIPFCRWRTRSFNRLTAAVRCLPGVALSVAICLFAVLGLRADAPTAMLHIANTGLNLEGSPTFLLTWNAVSNATYLVQSAHSLAPGTPWQTLDAVQFLDTAGSYQLQAVATDSTSLPPPAKFYRLVLPQPEIVSVEPAVLAPGAAVDLYVLGQCFETNDVLLINGVTQSNVTYASSQLVKPVFTPVAPGTYTVQLSRGGVVKSSFTVTCADPLANPELVLQGPPDAPMAAPKLRPWASELEKLANASGRKGLNAVNVKLGLMGDDDGELDLMKPGKMTCSRDWSAAFETQEGKKGINAVNVKLARGAGVLVNGSGVSASGRGAGVDPFSGEVQQCDVDLAIEGRGLDFIWARTYHSRIGRAGAPNSWTFSYDINIQPLGGDILIHNGTGRADTFKPDTNGVYTCPEFFSEGTLSNNVFKLTFADTGCWEFNPLTAAADSGKLAQIVDRNGNTMTLSYDVSGRLAEIVDDLGRTNTVAYDTFGRIASVTDFSGRTVRYEYDTNGDLVSVISPPVIGTPNGNDFPSGKTNRFTYSSGYANPAENHLLLSVIDASGQAIYQHVYQHNQTDLEFLRCISVQHWTNTPTMISYLPQTPTPANQFATLRCIVNDPGGDVTESFFDARGRCVVEREFTGRATPGVAVTTTVNRPAGKLRSSDPDDYETHWSWNNDSLCTAEILSGGEQVQCVYESRFWTISTHAHKTKAADLRVVREIASSPVDLDGDGVAETTERVWHYDYDPRFGSDSAQSRTWTITKNQPAVCSRGIIVTKPGGSSTGGSSADRVFRGTATGFYPDFVAGMARGIITIKPSSTGAGTTAGRSRGIIIGKPGSTGGLSANMSAVTGKLRYRPDEYTEFAVSATDPRGNVTTGVYDNSGNRVKVKFYWDRQSSADEDFAYDTHGQLTAITNAPDANDHRSVDTFAYAQGQVTQCVVDAGGLALTENYEYDARGNLTRCVDPRTNDWLYTYNSLDQLVQTKSALLGGGGGGGGGWRIRTQFTYDANDNLTLVAAENLDAAGMPGTNPFWRTQFIYDGGQRLTGCWRDKNGALVLRCTEVKYNAADQVVLYRSPEAVNGNDPLNTVAYEYDERGMLFREIGAPGSGNSPTNEWSYTANYNPATKKYVDASDLLTTTFTYDGFEGFDTSSSHIQGAKYTMFLADGKPCRATCSLQMEAAAKFVMPFTVSGGDGSAKLGLNHVPHKHLAAVKYEDISLNVLPSPPPARNIGARCSKITDPMGNVSTFNYDANDNLKVIRHFGQTNDVPGTNGNLRLAESRYEYDVLDRPVVLRDMLFTAAKGGSTGDFAKGEAITQISYAPNGQCTNVTDDLGRTTTLAYDTACRLSSVSSAGARTVYARFLDAAGNITRTTETDLSDLGGAAQVFSRTNVFDPLSRCVSTTDNVGNTSSFAYDSRGNCTSATDPNGNVTTSIYDGLSRIVGFTIKQSVTLAVIPGNSFAYDDNENCTSITDPRGNVTLHTYDSLNRLTQTTQADGTHNSLVWSPRSNLISETDANGTVIAHTYDANDRCISNHITPGAGIATTTTFETFAYDGCSQLVAASNDVSGCAFIYGSDGSCVSETRDGLTTTSTYDSLGNRLSLTYPGGRALTYAYNVLDRCTNILESSVSLASFDYDSPDRLAKISYANGMRTRIFYDGISATPNASSDFGHGRVSHILHAMNGGSPKISDITLAWDRNGNKLQRTDAIFQPAIPRTNTLVLGYDGANRLTEAAVLRGTTLLRDTVYGLDVAGNRTNVTGAASCSGSYTLSSTIPPGDSQMNRYTATPCDTRTYDADGNLASRSSAAGPTTYQYDCAGRLVLVQGLDFNIGALALVASYAYDALGRRISKTIYQSGLPPVTTDFLYDGGEVIEERSGTTTTATYVRARCFGAGQPHPQSCVEMRRGGKDYFLHTDDQGNALALTTTGGAVIERYDYDDYGAVTFLTSDGTATTAASSAVGNPYCWHGLRLDAETSLQNNDGGGYHEPQTGRTIGVSVRNPNGSVSNTVRTGGKMTIKVVNPDNQESNEVGLSTNPWSGGGGWGDPGDDDPDELTVTMTNSVGTSTVVTGGR